MISARTSMRVRWIFPGVGEIMDFSMEWLKKIFKGASSGEISFHELKTKKGIS